MYKFIIYNNETMEIELVFETENTNQLTGEGATILQVPLESEYQVGDIYTPEED